MLRDSFITLGSRIIIFILSLGTNALIARFLGPSEKGSYDLVILVITMASTVMVFGFDVTNVYFGAKDLANINVLLGNSLVAALVFGLSAALSLRFLTTIPSVEDYLFHNNINVTVIHYLGFTIPFLLGAIYVRELVRAYGRIVEYNMIVLLQTTSFLVAVGILLFYGKFSVQPIVWIWAGTQVLAFALSLATILWTIDRPIQFSFSHFRQMFRYGIQIHIGNVAQLLNYRFDILLVGYYLTPKHVAYYTLATILAEKLWEMPHAIRTVLLHRISQSNDGAIAQALTIQVTRLTSAFIIVVSILVIIFSYPLFYFVFGEAYLPSIPPLIALMPGIWLLGVSKLIVTYLTGSGSPAIGSYGAGISLVVTIILDMLLIPTAGITGAAVATSISYLVSLIIIGWAFQSQTGHNLLKMISPDFYQIGVFIRQRKLPIMNTLNRSPQ